MFRLAVVLALAIAACGAPQGPSSPAANGVRTYLDALKSDDPRDAYAMLSDTTRRRVSFDQFALEWKNSKQERAWQVAELEKSLPKSASRAAAAAAQPWTEWTGPRGETVLVGKNADSNRRLTFNVAKGDDFWLHVRGTPGAHVIIKLSRGKTPDLALLLGAAQLALAASGIVNGAAADVQYTRVRNVRAVPGKPGLVTVHDERVFHVTRDRDALAGWVND